MQYGFSREKQLESPELLAYLEGLSGEVVLETQNLGIQFGGLKAVEGVNLSVHQGELVGLIGPNGAGKTTIFNMLTGVYTPTEGSVSLCGKVMNGKKSYQFVREGIARTFQNIRLFKQMSVIDNVKVAMGEKYRYNFFDALFHTPRYRKIEAEREEEAIELLKIFHLEDKRDLCAAQLPYGLQRKLEIARALATDVKVLLLDEPAAGMNPSETAELLECIRTIRERFGVTILLIEHDMNLVMNVCERIMVLSFGLPLAHGFPHEIAHNKEVIEAYLGRDEVQG